MRKVKRSLRRHFGTTAHRVAVKPHKPWYWLLLAIIGAAVLGYAVSYWQWVGLSSKADDKAAVQLADQVLQYRLVQAERQLQVEKAAQGNLSKDLAALQAESMRLKEDIAFYRNILTDRNGASEVKIHTFKITKSNAGEYQYHILLMQAGSHDKPVQGSLQLKLAASADSEPQTLPLALENSSQSPTVSFKYYQQLDGSFSLPENSQGGFLELAFIEKGANRPKISQRVSIPG